MGCDIHAFIEVKINGRWVNYSHPRIRRWYRLFGKIAGVRSEEETPIAQPKGLPADLSEIVRIEFEKWEPDAHSATWLDASEIRQLCEWAQSFAQACGDEFPCRWEHEELGYISGNAVYGVPGSGYPEQYEDVRLVCWFDN